MKTRISKARGAKTSTPARKTPKPKTKVDKAWIQERIRDLDMSQRQFAFRYLAPIGMDPSMLSRVLNGDRELSPKEIETFAAALHVPHAELLRHLGVDPDVGAADAVSVIGWIDARGELHEGRAEGARRIRLSQATSDTLRAVRFQVPAHFADGWVAFFDERVHSDRGRRIDQDAIGTLSVICMPDKRRYVRVLERGYERGRYNLLGFCAEEDPINGVEILSASPVLWIKAGAD